MKTQRPALFALFRDTFQLMSRNLVLLYPILLLLLIIRFLSPGQSQLPLFSLEWWGWISLIFLIFSAFMAGWNNMIYKVCLGWTLVSHIPKDNWSPLFPVDTKEQESEDEEALPIPIITSPFKLFTYFLPGIGRSFLPIAFGYLIQILVFVSIAFYDLL